MDEVITVGLTLDNFQHLGHAPLKSAVSLCGVDALVEEADDQLHVLQQLRELRVRLLTGLLLRSRFGLLTTLKHKCLKNECLEHECLKHECLKQADLKPRSFQQG